MCLWNNWNTAQPSAGTDDEDYVEFQGSDSKRNDTTNNDTNITCNIIEYAISDSVPKQNPDNGHYYQYVNHTGITWPTAKTAAESKVFNDVNGHLVTITTESENEFIDNLVPEHSYSWIGLTEKVTEGDFKWADCDPDKSYRNGDSNQPSAGTDDEDYVQFVASNGKWNDVSNNIDSPADNYITRYVVEYDDIQPAQNPENGHYYIY